jgi:leader peptidase (prepilin peptidase)/N-methyltransferase
MSPIIVVIVFVYGLIIGSFLNVCIYRIPNEMSIIKPPSHCTSCGKRLKPLDLIPVFSWLFLRGRCRYCGSKISVRYLLIELLTGFSFLPLLFIYGFSVNFILYALMTSVFITIFFIDSEHMIIPNGLVLTAFIIALIHFGFNLYIKEYIELSDVLTPIIGMVSGSGALLLVAVIASKIYKTEDTVGMGDVKLLFPIGLLLGYKLLILMMLLACITTSVASLILIKAGKKTRKDLIPFGPFIVASTYFTLLFGENIITWYMSLL